MIVPKLEQCPQIIKQTCKYQKDCLKKSIVQIINRYQALKSEYLQITNTCHRSI